MSTNFYTLNLGIQILIYEKYTQTIKFCRHYYRKIQKYFSKTQRINNSLLLTMHISKLKRNTYYLSSTSGGQNIFTTTGTTTAVNGNNKMPTIV